MNKIFITYRRADSEDQTGRIFDRLVGAFSRDNVFRDLDQITVGVDFRIAVQDALQKADIVLVVVGPSWLNAADQNGRRRLDNPSDHVRLEVETALRLDKVVIPVLVRGANIPDAGELPQTIGDLSYKHAARVRPDPDFHRDMDRLIQDIKKKRIVRPPEPTTAPATPGNRRSYVLAAVGFAIFAFVLWQIATRPGNGPGRGPGQGAGQGPPAQPNRRQDSPATNAGPDAQRAALPVPRAPSKSLPSLPPDSKGTAPDTKTAQSDNPRPSAQAPHIPIGGAPPAPAAPGSQSDLPGPPGHVKVRFAETKPVDARPTTDRGDAESSEGVPPPPLIPRAATAPIRVSAANGTLGTVRPWRLGSTHQGDCPPSRSRRSHAGAADAAHAISAVPAVGAEGFPNCILRSRLRIPFAGLEHQRRRAVRTHVDAA